MSAAASHTGTGDGSSVSVGVVPAAAVRCNVSAAFSPSTSQFRLGLGGKVVLVTGSTAGIGYGIALGFAREGSVVYINGRHETGVMEAIKRIDSDPTRHPQTVLKAAIGDLATGEGSDKVMAQVTDELDILICNVGVYHVQDFFSVTDSDWLRYHETNIMSSVRMCRHFLPKMLSRNQNGRVILISSEAGVKMHPYMLHYSMSKTAQIALASGLAQLTKGTSVTVNTVLPGPTDTEGLQDYMKGVALKQNTSVEEAMRNYFQTVEPTSLLQRPITVEEIASYTLFLASHHSAAINGSAQRVEGGILRNM